MQIEEDWIKGKSIGIKMQSVLPSGLSRKIIVRHLYLAYFNTVVAAIVFNCTIVAKNEHAKVEWLDALLAAKAEYVLNAGIKMILSRPCFEIACFTLLPWLMQSQQRVAGGAQSGGKQAFFQSDNICPS